MSTGKETTIKNPTKKPSMRKTSPKYALQNMIELHNSIKVGDQYLLLTISTKSQLSIKIGYFEIPPSTDTFISYGEKNEFYGGSGLIETKYITLHNSYGGVNGLQRRGQEEYPVSNFIYKARVLSDAIKFFLSNEYTQILSTYKLNFEDGSASCIIINQGNVRKFYISDCNNEIMFSTENATTPNIQFRSFLVKSSINIDKAISEFEVLLAEKHADVIRKYKLEYAKFKPIQIPLLLTTNKPFPQNQ